MGLVKGQLGFLDTNLFVSVTQKARIGGNTDKLTKNNPVHHGSGSGGMLRYE